MPDANRLQELRRQRALVQEQLAWLDREIAALAQPTATAPIPVVARPNMAPPGRPPAALGDIPATDADALIAKFAAEEGNRGAISKQGCWIAFLVVMAVLVAATAAIAHWKYR